MKFPEAEISSIQKIYAFNESPYRKSGDPWFRNVTPYVDLASWEGDMEVLFPDWSEYRIEVRYVYAGCKYRAILRPGDTFEIPTTIMLGTRFPKIQHAHLIGADSSVRSMDVTARVTKYLGPGNAHRELEFHAHDIFPFDDHEDNGTRFVYVRIVTLRGSMRDFEYAKNPRVHL